ncbi:tetratricopeptide repeat protein [Vibrio sp. EA2]|uniref:tetratricopeptide repeat protein n=1 Tax=Vibrio sp. EA2 TaxID=3079860 RepID=UPI002948D53C|nr:tetratricopeptide repeat protein [Vibrio sp. EA2]MDV6253631.1 tetratricopeptide repeat protein [Vibrio sp. EA2]
MSAINKALSEITEKASSSELTRAEIPHVSRSKPWLWLVAGFSLSLAVGGWAVSQGPVASDEVTQYPAGAGQKVESNAAVPTLSPTSKMTPETSRQVYTKPVQQQRVTKTAATNPPVTDASAPEVDSFTPKQEVSSVAQSPILLAQVASVPSESAPSDSVTESSMNIEQVELTHHQLAIKALGRAEKALDANDMQTALSAYQEALRYEPTNADTRQKLAALYFGKGDTRKAYEIMQEGINLDINNQTLRLALSKLLVKAKQPQAALSPLVHMPPMPNRDYLAMRAVLAQKQKQDDIALESYQLLTQRDPENARWWMGLGIQQERALQFTSAISSYNKALEKVGISNQSQAFIRDRLTVLKQLENAQ